MGKEAKFYRPQFDLNNPEDREFIDLVRQYSKKWGMTCPTVIKKIGLLQLKGLMQNTSLPKTAGVELPPGLMAGFLDDNPDMVYEENPDNRAGSKQKKMKEAEAPAVSRKQKTDKRKGQGQASGNAIMPDMSDQDLDRFFDGLDEG